VKVKVWNPTIANLTLMALGSSAPEILLAIIETISTIDNDTPGELGPATIVGSAAFNLLGSYFVCLILSDFGDYYYFCADGEFEED
jgi:solute carrier family 8 (sodium/calcium exchanger)